MRLLAVEACGPIAKLLSKQEAVKQILPIVQRLSEVRPAACRALVKARPQLWPCTIGRVWQWWLHGGPQGHLLN